MDRFHLGNTVVHRIEEWQGTFSPPDALFAGFDAEGWIEHRDEFVPEYFDLESGRLYAFLQSWVLDTGKLRILFDTGAGNDKERPNLPIFGNLRSDFLGNLARSGYEPVDIDIVVCSHVHVDHVGWNTRLVDGQWVPTFPNAQYILPLADRDYWNPMETEAGPQGIGAAVNAGMFEDSVMPIMAAGRAEWVSDGHEIVPGIFLHSRPGHTPGSMAMEVRYGSDAAMFIGDIMHHPAQVYRPDWNSIFCEDPAQARSTRRAVLDDAADRNLLLIPAHFGGSHMVRIRRDGSGFRPVLNPLV